MNKALISLCLYCSSEDNVPYKLFETEVLKVVLSLPQSQLGHLLIVPKEHVGDLFRLPRFDEFFSTVYEVSRALRTSMKSDRIGVASEMTESGHGYLHLIPINSAKDFLPEKKLSLDEQELITLRDSLRDSLDSAFSFTA